MGVERCYGRGTEDECKTAFPGRCAVCNEKGDITFMDRLALAQLGVGRD